MTIPTALSSSNDPTPDSPRSIASTDSNAPLPSFVELAPPRPGLTKPSEEAVIEIPGLDVGVRLKVDAGNGCGGIAWPAGEVLSRYLAHRVSLDRAYLSDKKVLELGSGTGLVGIALGLLQPECDIWVTDQLPLLDLMQQNITHNAVETNVHLAEQDWGAPLCDTFPATFDVVLAADCVYFEPAFPLLVQTLCDLAPLGQPIEILFCWKKRRKADRRFFQLLKKHFDSAPVEDDAPGERERYNREGVSLIRLTRRR